MVNSRSNLLKSGGLTSLALIAAAFVFGQESREEKQERYRVKIVKTENGKTSEIDTVVFTREAADNLHPHAKAYMIKSAGDGGAMPRAFFIETEIEDNGGEKAETRVIVISDEEQVSSLAKKGDCEEHKSVRVEKIVTKGKNDGDETTIYRTPSGDEIKFVIDQGKGEEVIWLERSEDQDDNVVIKKIKDGEEESEEAPHLKMTMFHHLSTEEGGKKAFITENEDVFVVGNSDGEPMEIITRKEVDADGVVTVETTINGKPVNAEEAGEFKVRTSDPKQSRVVVDEDHAGTENVFVRVSDLDGKSHEISVVISKINKAERKDFSKKEDWSKEIAETATLAPLDLEFYPNPNHGKFNLSFILEEAKATSISIKDMQGREVFQENLQDFPGYYNQEIDISKQDKGIYILQIVQGGTGLAHKIIIQ